MAGHEGDVIAKRPEPPDDRTQQLLMIAPGQVASADRALEQHIADKGEIVGSAEKNDMARRMAGAVAHFHLDIADRDLIAVLEPTVRRKRPGVPGLPFQ